MQVKPRHFLHPLRSVRQSGLAVREYLERRRFAERGRKHFIGDNRYDLNAVSEGFADRLDSQIDDHAILQRICSAYQRALTDEVQALDTYRPTQWWEMQRHGSLLMVMNALANGNIEVLQKMYRNFYRDPCSAGLIIVQSLAKQYFGGGMRDQDRRYVLADTLYRLDQWKRMLPRTCSIQKLAGPTIGNPFGVMVEGTLVRVGAEYQHYCAGEVLELLENRAATVAEIGGGYGGMAYYLLRDCQNVKYLDFDVAESIALTSYFLMRSFPSRKFLLYGEGDLNEETFEKSDVVLLPAFALQRIPCRVDITFCSHAMSDLRKPAQTEYAAQIAAMKSEWLLCVGDSTGMATLDATLEESGNWSVRRGRDLRWHVHRNARAQEIERLYRRRN